MSARPIVALLGCGRVSQTMSALLRYAELRLWGRSAPFSLDNFHGATWCDTIAAACEDAQAVVFTLPVSALREVARDFGEVARADQVVLLTARGVAEGFVLPHAVLRQETCVRKIGVVGGPLQTLDVQAGRPTAVVVASRFAEPSRFLQQLVKDLPAFIYPSPDVVGLQIAAAMGNVTSIALGMASAMSLGETVRGVLLTRGLGEAARLGTVLGAEANTFASLAGMGALIPPPTPNSDRHIELGEMLSRGMTLAAALATMDGEVDGVLTAGAAVLLAQTHHLALPLVEAVHAVIGGHKEAGAALAEVLHVNLDFGDLRASRNGLL